MRPRLRWRLRSISDQLGNLYQYVYIMYEIYPPNALAPTEDQDASVPLASYLEWPRYFVHCHYRNLSPPPASVREVVGAALLERASIGGSGVDRLEEAPEMRPARIEAGAA